MASERDELAVIAVIGRARGMLPYDEMSRLAVRIADALTAARAEEREACARLVEKPDFPLDAPELPSLVLRAAAAAIRARGEG